MRAAFEAGSYGASAMTALRQPSISLSLYVYIFIYICYDMI